jgi:hypothetical protein
MTGSISSKALDRSSMTRKPVGRCGMNRRALGKDRRPPFSPSSIPSSSAFMWIPQDLYGDFPMGCERIVRM